MTNFDTLGSYVTLPKFAEQSAIQLLNRLTR